ncbi:hypothetical protein [Sanguibacter antarcticus]|uniref:hypothetical protein n=1 Tax=Sanguibacter antarcticus TaxID=372484 RepID=UPI001473A941|nr:hypothetical protein [Sanguibacter antarcticus]
MASIEKRLRGDGNVAYRVTWRDPTQPGRQSMTFDDRRQAEQTIKLLDGSGQRLTLAIEVANAIRQGGPTVEDAVREHIELLNRVGEDTRSGYRYRGRDHINLHLGALPVKALTWHQVTLWIRDLSEQRTLEQVDRKHPRAALRGHEHRRRPRLPDGQPLRSRATPPQPAGRRRHGRPGAEGPRPHPGQPA